MLRNCKWLIGVGVLSAALSFVPGVQADMKLLLTDGLTTVEITDGGAGDINAAVGAITFLGAIGDFTLNVSTGVSKPLLAPGHLDLNSVDLHSGASAGTLWIALTDTDYVFGGSQATLISEIGGTAEGSLTYWEFADDDNNEFARADIADAIGSDADISNSMGPFSGAFSGTATSSGPLSGTYSLTELVRIDVEAGPPHVTSFNAHSTVVPAPGAVVLGVIGLGLIGWVRRRLA